MNKKLNTVWRRMIDRCYNTEHSAYPSYGGRGVYVCSEWLTYSGFKDWAKENYRDGFELDKDILYKGNLCHCPEFCRFIPAAINKLLTGRDALRGEFPLGASLPSNGRKYRAQITKDGAKVHLGTRATPMEAHKLWQKAKITAIIEASLVEGLPLEISKSLVAKAENIVYDCLHDLETKDL